MVKLTKENLDKLIFDNGKIFPICVVFFDILENHKDENLTRQDLYECLKNGKENLDIYNYNDLLRLDNDINDKQEYLDLIKELEKSL